MSEERVRGSGTMTKKLRKTSRRRFLTTSTLAIGSLAFPGGRAQGQGAIKIGAQGIASGSHTDYGRQILMGARLAAEEIGAAGGMLGRPVEIDGQDASMSLRPRCRQDRRTIGQPGKEILRPPPGPALTALHKPVCDQHMATL